MPSSAQAQPQHSIYEKTITDEDLEALLEHRMELKEEASKVNADLRKVQEGVKERLDKLDVADAPIRVGRFVVQIRETAGGFREFEVGPSKRVVVKTIDNE